MSYLFDTVALSEMRKRHRDPHFHAWLVTVAPTDVHTSTVVLGEIERGIVLAPTPLRAAKLTDWLRTTIDEFGDRIIPVGIVEAREWGRLTARISFNGPDTLIAATALARGLTVVTRNVKHFVSTGVPILNPWEPS